MNFVPNRLITENVLVAFEIHHFINTKAISNKNFMTLKLDVNKAYYRVEWDFLRQILLRLGIHSCFTYLIMLYVSTVSYTYLLNGVQFGNLRPERDLCQGDPLSIPIYFCGRSLHCTHITSRKCRD